jgi:hypothetical protein
MWDNSFDIYIYIYDEHILHTKLFEYLLPVVPLLPFEFLCILEGRNTQTVATASKPVTPKRISFTPFAPCGVVMLRMPLHGTSDARRCRDITLASVLAAKCMKDVFL